MAARPSIPRDQLHVITGGAGGAAAAEKLLRSTNFSVIAGWVNGEGIGIGIGEWARRFRLKGELLQVKTRYGETGKESRWYTVGRRPSQD